MNEPHKTRTVNNGVQHLFYFPNNYGASVVKHDFSYGSSSGLWEIAVLKLVRDEKDVVVNWDISYDTPITNDVLGHIPSDVVDTILEEIKALPKVEHIINESDGHIV